VDSTMFSTSSMLRTMELILGLKPISQFDAAATPMYASFQSKPDMTPYRHVKPAVDLNEKNKANAWGAALSAKMRGSGQVAVCFFGDGALGQGLLYEAMNMAALWKLPVIYVCENNLYGEYTPGTETVAGDILSRPRAMGVHAESVDGQDVQAVYATMRRMVERARRGEGPAFLECKTYRYYGHHVGDVNRDYRTRDEEREWMTNRDPLQTLASRLMQQRLAEQSVFDRIHVDVKGEIDSAVQYALDAPFPKPDQVDQDVYA